MKSQNYISLKILTLALLLIASCEVWAVNFGQSQTNPFFIQTQITDTRDNHNVLDQDFMFKPAFSNLFTNDMLADPLNGRVYFIKDGNPYNQIGKREVFFCRPDDEGMQKTFKKQEDELKSKYSEKKLNFYKENFERNNINLPTIVCGGSIVIEEFRTNGKGGGFWTKSSTWKNGKVPQTEVNILVAEGDTLFIDTNVTIESLELARNAKVFPDNKHRTIEINKDIFVKDSASIISNYGSGKLDCNITGNIFLSKVTIAQTAKVNFENLKILGRTVFINGNMNVMNFIADKPKNFIRQKGTVLNIGQKK